MPASPSPAAPLPYRFHQFLPAIYLRPECEFLRRFLEGLEPSWASLEAHLRDPSLLVDPRRTPERYLRWLAEWVGLSLDQNWPERKRRLLLQEAVDLYQLRGTARGLGRFLEIYTGVRPRIVEPFEGTTLGEKAVLGRAVVGDVPPNCFTLTVFRRPDDGVDERVVREIVEMEKPAHTACRISFVHLQASDQPASA